MNKSVYIITKKGMLNSYNKKFSKNVMAQQLTL